MRYDENQNADQVTEIWRKYEKCRDYLDQKRLVDRTDECWRFYLGDQWHGLESDGERLPSLNFIKPTVKYKVGVVSQNLMTANYSPMGETSEEEIKMCEMLNEHFRRTWEKGKMDSGLWEIAKAAAIQGDAHLFYGTSDLTSPQVIPNVNLMLANEQESEIQKQKYILIYERRMVSDIRREARENGIPAERIETIVNDDETQDQIGEVREIKQESSTDGKCSSILYLYKDEAGIVHRCRSTKTCVYQPDTAIAGRDAEGNPVGGLTSYPIVSYVWEKRPNDARGQSEVEALIPNQIEVNKTLARRSVAVRLCAFPRIAYDAQSVANPDALDRVGTKIKINNTSSRNISEMISYLNPTSMSGDAKQLSDELLHTTRELAGAGENAVGNTDPTKASGAAIIAVKNQNEIPLNENVSIKAQFIEDLALLWFDMWVAYNPNGLEIRLKGEDGQERVEVIPAERLAELKVDVRVDVSQANPFSKLAKEQALENMLLQQRISFEEYLEALDDDSNVPKAKIQDILKKRQEQQKLRQVEQQKEVIPNEMPAM